MEDQLQNHSQPPSHERRGRGRGGGSNTHRPAGQQHHNQGNYQGNQRRVSTDGHVHAKGGNSSRGRRPSGDGHLPHQPYRGARGHGRNRGGGPRSHESHADLHHPDNQPNGGPRVRPINVGTDQQSSHGNQGNRGRSHRGGRGGAHHASSGSHNPTGFHHHRSTHHQPAAPDHHHQPAHHHQPTHHQPVAPAHHNQPAHHQAAARAHHHQPSHQPAPHQPSPHHHSLPPKPTPRAVAVKDVRLELPEQFLDRRPRRIETPRDTHRETHRPPPARNARPQLYDEYLPLSQVEKGLKDKTLLKGTLRINKRNRSEGYITSDDREQDIMIPGSKFRNRALEGDVVAVRLLEGDELEREIKRLQDDKDRKQSESDARTRRVRGHGNFTSSSESDTEEETDLTSAMETLNVTDAADTIPEETSLRDLPLGKIVYIIQRREHGYAGTLMLTLPASKDRPPPPKPTSFPNLIWFKPIDKRVPFIALPTEDVPKQDLMALLDEPEKLAQDLFTAEITRWGVLHKSPFGRLLGRLGLMGELTTETSALLVDNDVRSEPFSEAVLECLPPTPWQIPESEIAKRRDLRHERIVTIDPPTAKDLDDAVSCKVLEDGLLEIGVHIADVSYFVTEGSALDTEAKTRATTVYLVQKAIPMLPALLCEELCSLNPGVDRLAFSVVWKMDPQDYSIKHVWYGRTVIRTCGKLAYDHAQDFIDGKTWEYRRQHANETIAVGVKLLPPPTLYDGWTEDQVRQDVLKLYDISLKLREQRYKNGALSMNSIKLWFALDQQGNPVNTGVYEQKEANRLIEEFMLLANMAVAHKLAESFPQNALLRRHPPPNKRQMVKFLDLVTKLGYEMNAESSGSLQSSFDAIQDPEVQETLRLLCIKPMQRAKYFCTNDLPEDQFGHYALNVPLYTHFTSPIRRYADLVVHRMLEEAIHNLPCSCPQEVCTNVAENCNKRKELAKSAQEASSKLYLCVYLNELIKLAPDLPLVEDALVVEVGERSFDVMVPKYGLEKRVWIEDNFNVNQVLGSDYDASKMKLTIYWNLIEECNPWKLPTKDVEVDEETELPKVRPDIDPNTYKRQVISVFSKVRVRITPLVKLSPVDFKVYAVHPDAVLPEVQGGLTEGGETHLAISAIADFDEDH